MTQVESYSAKGPESSVPSRVATDHDDDPGAEGPDPARRRGLSWVLAWTVVGALAPGSGLIAAGRRVIGGIVLGTIMMLVAAGTVFVLVGDPARQGLALAVDPQALLLLAVLAIACGLVWAAVIVVTHLELRRCARLGRTQQALGGLLVVVLVAAAVVPAYRVGDYALITRSVVNSDSVFAGGGDASTRPLGQVQGHVVADPWANKPQVNVLLIGSDAGYDRIGVRPDTLILASINTKTGKTVMFSIPRSLQRAPFAPSSPGRKAWPHGYYCPGAPAGSECLINAVWTWAEDAGRRYYPGRDPGLHATEDAVSGVLGQPIDTYVMLNLRGFRDFVDALGGVTVDVHERLPIGGDTYTRTATNGWIEKGNNQHLDGYHALWFARSRWSTGDYDRMQRQRCVIGALVDQTDPLDVARNFPALAKALKKNMSTGIDAADLSAWVDLSQRIQKGGVTSLVFDPDVINTVKPDFLRIHSTVRAAIEGTTRSDAPSASASPSPGSSASPTPSGTQASPRGKKPTNRIKPQSLKSVC